MKLLKAISVATAICLTSISAQASMVSVGGVKWDTAGNFDFVGETSESFFQSFDSQNGLLTGFGRIVTVQGNANFCTNCELLFKFKASVDTLDNEGAPKNSSLPTTKRLAGEQLSDFSQIYFEFKPTLVELVVASQGSFNGTLASITGSSWLNLDLVDFWSSVIFSNSDTSLSNPILGKSAGTLIAKNDAALASSYFYNTPNFSQGSVDSDFGSRYSGSNPNFSPASNIYFKADTEVSEPTSLAMLGLGLLALGGAFRRKAMAKD